MVATGIDIHGEEHKFTCIGEELWCNNKLWCPTKQLVSLTIPKGVESVWCMNNQLTELIIPEGVTSVWCFNNKITHLDLPSSVRSLTADKEIIGLEKYIGTEVKTTLQ